MSYAWGKTVKRWTAQKRGPRPVPDASAGDGQVACPWPGCSAWFLPAWEGRSPTEGAVMPCTGCGRNVLVVWIRETLALRATRSWK